MTTVLKSNTLTEFERENIANEIESDLVELFYKASPVGSITAFLTSVFLFTFFYFTNPAKQFYLFAWIIGFNIVNFLSLMLYLRYKKHRATLETSTWLYLLSSFLILFSCFYGSCVFFLPESVLQQFIGIAILMMIAAALTIGTVGVYKLAIITAGFILAPLVIWFLLKPEILYKTWGIFVVIYYIFLIGMNHRSTEWLKNSLRLKIETSFFTHQANHDLLTDLPNQRGLLQFMDDFIAAAKKNHSNFITICFSVNRLEMFNNSLGYQAGDLIIQSLSRRFRSLIAEENYKDKNQVNRVVTLPRPDSFTILVEPVDEHNLDKELGKYLSALDLPFHLGKRGVTLTASVGVSMYPRDGESARALLSNAYAAMFQAKQEGGTQIEYYTKAINAKTPRDLELENDLYRAIEKEEFVVHYQPLVDLSNGQIYGMEALVRWQHPKLGLLMPGDFLMLAAETGLIVAIGEWVLQTAALQTKRWNQAGYSMPIKVSINLAAKQLRKGNLIEVVNNVLNTSKLDPNHLDLELTETEMLDESVAPLIKELTKLGVTLSIDDFGTGYSGLSYLKYFEVDKIKIDRSFIQNIHKNEESATIVSAILAMAKELNIKTLAEGIETKEELDFLTAKGCNYGQGYYFSKPVSTEDFTKLLETGKVYSIS